ncbi:MAG: glycosyltransferase, partial [Bacteroidaceae bacterium]|nr:glycosyltransferase [Bacteroidaceae bacterium]
GALPMDEVQRIIANNDVLVLPSLHDGWGAVINEAMTLGTIPVCSDKCGAKALINKSGFGGIFEVNKPQKLADLLAEFSKNKESIRQNRKSRIEWAKENISPMAVSDYFISSL